MRIGKDARRQAEAVAVAPPRQAMSDEERKVMADALMRLPKDRVVQALRSAGLDREADECEQRLAEEHIAEMRRQQLDSANALPEEERLPRLIELGFTEEARELSERMAAEREAAESDVKGREEEKKPASTAARKKGGRPKKQRK